MMKSLAEVLEVDAARSRADAASIAQSWDELAAALEAETISERQFTHMTDLEPPVDADPLVVNLWARALRRAARDPKGIGTDAEWGKTWPCRCGPGDGWTFETMPSPVSGIVMTYAKPCGDCNHRQRALWLDHWTLGGDHRCPECLPRGGKTSTPNAYGGQGDDQAAARAAEKDAAGDAILFGESGLE